MDDEHRRRILSAWSELVEDIRSAPASEAQVADFEHRFGPMPPDFRWFLRECGGGVVGSEWVDDVESLVRTHEKFSAESGEPHGWRMKGVFVIGWDGCGNPFGIDVQSGKVLCEDHNFGGIHEIAPTFDAFLANGLLDVARRGGLELDESPASEVEATIEYAASFIDYFAKCVAEDGVLERELAEARRIVTMMRAAPANVDGIERALRDVDASVHFTGTGWTRFTDGVRRWLVDQARNR